MTKSQLSEYLHLSSMSRLVLLGAFLELAIAIAPDANPASAQIVPDTTLGDESSIINRDAIIRGTPSDQIDGGAIRGFNLFHSFEQFNVDAGRGAYFSNPSGIENIFSRVTGSNASNILGRLGVLGEANLFLINPNGILFGTNASLDVQGSFAGTTANALEFGDRGVFSASNPEAPNALLAIAPSAFLFNQIPVGNLANNSASGLVVPNASSLLLVGGNINLDGGQIFTSSGQIELGGLSAPGRVELTNQDNGLQLNFPQGVPRGNITFQNRSAALTTEGGAVTVHVGDLALSDVSLISVSSEAGAEGSLTGDVTIDAMGTVTLDSGSFIANLGLADSLADVGNISINAQAIRLNNGSQISTDGERNRGAIRLRAAEDITLDNNSLILTFGNPTSIGDSGDIIVTARTINLSNQASINSGTIGQGQTGRTLLQAADTISLSGGSSISSGSGASVFGGTNREPSGNIEIQARSLSLEGQYTSISSGNFDEGRSGNIVITTDDSISLNGYSNISASTGGQGDGGDVQIQTRQLSLTNGAFIDTVTFGTGNSGNLFINVSDAIEIIGSTEFTSRTGAQIVSNSRFSASTFGSGNAGQISIEAGRLSLQGGGAINADAGIDSTGRGGDITIRATDGIEVVGELFNGRFSSNISTATLGSGDAGDLTLETRSFSIREGALVSAASIGSGRGGDLTVNAAELVEVVGTTPDNSFSLLSAGTSGSGDAGRLTIHTGRLSIRDGASVITGSIDQSSGRGGDLTINASELVEVVGTSLDGQISSRLSASTSGIGDAGDLTINTSRLSIRDVGQVSTSTNTGSTGQGGTLTINASDIVEVVGESSDGETGSVISTSTFSSGNAGPININTRQLIVREGGFITTEARPGSTGHGGDLTVNASDVEVLGNAPNSQSFSYLATSTAGPGNAGRLNISTQRLSLRNGGYITTEVQSGGSGQGGELTINAADSVEVMSSSPDDVLSSGLATVTSGLGNAGRLSIDTRRLTLGNGGFISTGTSSSGRGGDLIINATELVEILANPADADLADGLFTATVGSGNAGDLSLTTQRLRIRDGGAVSAATGAGSTGQGGNVNITASDSIEVVGTSENGQLQSLLSVRSRGEGQAGNLTVNTPRLTVQAGAGISAESSAVDGGNIRLNVDRLLLLRQGGNISATAGLAQGAGNGGNITISAPEGFVVAIPAENSDISANAFTGAGGRVEVTSQGIFGLQFRPELTPLSDITASSEFGTSGTVAINSPDASSLQNSLSQLPQGLLDADTLLANSCIARHQEPGTFFVTGPDGLPERPGEGPISTYPTGFVRAVPPDTNASRNANKSAWQVGDAIVEPQGVYQLADGRLVMSRACS